MHLFKWSTYEVFNTYTGRVVASFKGPGIAARLYAVWLGSPFDYAVAEPLLCNPPGGNEDMGKANASV